MEYKKLNIPAELLDELKEIPGGQSLNEPERVTLFLQAALETVKKEKAQGQLQKILDAQDAGFSADVLAYTQRLAAADATSRRYIRGVALTVADMGAREQRLAWNFTDHLSGKGATA